jgi:hypothetical protein
VPVLRSLVNGRSSELSESVKLGIEGAFLEAGGGLSESLNSSGW